MRATVTAVAASLLACYGSAVAQETESAAEQESSEGIPATPHQAGTAREIESDAFTKLDQDGDGLVSRQEAQGYAMLSDNWSQYDQDGDGALSSREFGDFRAEHGDVARTGEPTATGAAEAEGMPETRHQKETVGGDLVAQLDSNGDGTISEQEAQAHAELADNWDQYDEDGDGKLGSAELDRLEQELRDIEEAE